MVGSFVRRERAFECVVFSGKEMKMTQKWTTACATQTQAHTNTHATSNLERNKLFSTICCAARQTKRMVFFGFVGIWTMNWLETTAHSAARAHNHHHFTITAIGEWKRRKPKEIFIVCCAIFMFHFIFFFFVRIRFRMESFWISVNFFLQSLSLSAVAIPPDWHLFDFAKQKLNNEDVGCRQAIVIGLFCMKIDT